MAPLLQLPFVNISFDPITDAVEVGWQRAPSSAQLRQVSQLALRLVQQLHARAWIGDLRQLGPLGARDQQWLDDVWRPQLAASTVSALAVVLPPTRRATTAAAADALENAPFCTQYFSCPSAARQWISRLP